MVKRAEGYACPHCGAYLVQHPQSPDLWLKCPSCGFCRPTLKNHNPKKNKPKDTV